jgi:hypothetical protein
LGHNYKIIGNGEILSSYFANKKVDILIVVKNNKLFCIDAITDLDFIKILDSSEIRSCGKNNYKLFTPKHFNSNFDIKKITTSYARMGNKMNVNRYKMLGIYFVRKLTDFIPKPNINSIRQNKATISLHFTINKTLEELQDYYNSRI